MLQFFHCFSLILLALSLSACGTKELDPLERLQQPPQIVSTSVFEEPAMEEKNEPEEGKLSENLGDKVKLRGKDNAPLMTLTLPFDESWQIMARALKRQKIKVTDKDREAGIFLVNYDVDSYDADQSFLQSLSNAVTFSHYGLRKFKLLVKQAGKTTMVLVKDLGAVVKEADPKEGQDEVIDDTNVGPEDSQKRILHTLYKYLHGGSDESETEPLPHKDD